MNIENTTVCNFCGVDSHLIRTLLNDVKKCASCDKVARTRRAKFCRKCSNLSKKKNKDWMDRNRLNSERKLMGIIQTDED